MVIVPHSANQATEEHLHVELKLLDLATDTWKPTPSDLEDLIDHLTACTYCQIVLGTIIVAQIEGNTVESRSAGDSQLLLSHVAETIHKTHLQNDVSVYVEVLEREGEKEASRRFPVLTAHLKICETCQCDVEEIRAVLHQMIKVGLIAPILAETHR